MGYNFAKSTPLKYKRSSPKYGLIAEVVIKENGIRKDFITAKNSNKTECDFLSLRLSKYGFINDKNEVNDEINALNDFYLNNK